MLYYCQTPEGNFGDDLNPWLWNQLAPEVCTQQPGPLFVGIGTILSYKLPTEPVKVVFGAGCGYTRPPLLDNTWRVYAVRGPLTAARLNLDPALALTDSAVLVRRIPLPPQPKRYPVSFMPHHKSVQQADWPALCARSSLHYIDPRANVELVLAQILQSRILLAEAMHGAIVADALRVPWIPVRLYSQFLQFKWRDWTQSLQLPLAIADVPPIFQQPLPWRQALLHHWKRAWGHSGLGKEKWKRLQTGVSDERQIDATLRALESLPARRDPCLSDDHLFAQVESRLFERLGELRSHWRQGFGEPWRKDLLKT